MRGVDTISIDGNELSLSGTGLGTVVLDSTPTLVSSTTYRYGFTGSFVEGSINVDFMPGSFTDLASTPNVNALETESFTVVIPPPPPTVQIIDDKDTDFTTTGSWLTYGKGYKDNVTYIGSGSGENVARWSFTGLTPGNYEVAVTWLKGNKRTSVEYKVFDNITQVGEIITVDQSPPTAADYIEEDTNFQIIISSVAVSSGTLVLELSDNAADDFVVADAVRIELVSPIGPDTAAPSADLLSPANDSSIDLAELNAQGYLEVSFSDVGEGVDTTSIDGKTSHPTDLFPDNPELTTISDFTNFIIEYTVDDEVIYDTDWKQSGNDADFVAKLESVLELVLAAEQAQDAEWAALLYQEALGIVDDQLIPKADGFHGGALEDDWIIVEEAQDIIYPDLLSLSEYLSLILQ